MLQLHKGWWQVLFGLASKIFKGQTSVVRGECTWRPDGLNFFVCGFNVYEQGTGRGISQLLQRAEGRNELTSHELVSHANIE